MNVNQNHPERKEHEIFISNVTLENFQESRYALKRLGNIAYSTKGEIVNSLFPMFVNKKEFDDVQAQYNQNQIDAENVTNEFVKTLDKKSIL